MTPNRQSFAISLKHGHSRAALIVAAMLVALAAGLASNSAHAGNRHGDAGFAVHIGHHSGHAAPRHVSHWRDRGYRHGYRHNRYARHYRHRRHHDRGLYLAGGLILGSVITHALHERHEPVVHRRVRTRVSGAVMDDAAISRRLFRDRDGNCFERTYTRAGDEVLSELDPSACAW